MKVGDSKLVNLDAPDGRNPTLRITAIHETPHFGVLLDCVARNGATIRITADRWARPNVRKKAVPCDPYGQPLAQFGEVMRSETMAKRARQTKGAE